jgi:hypothetical protein
MPVSEEFELHGWDRLIGRWETEGAHPMLPGEAIRGTSAFEWLDGQTFVIWRSHYDHPRIPNAITIIGVTNGRLSMHYSTAVAWRGVLHQPRSSHVAVLA